MRHAVECVKHSQLCEMGEATAVPYGSQNAKDVSIAISKHGPTSLTFGENSTPAVKIFADALEEKEREKLNGKATWETCIKLLCEYKGPLATPVRASLARQAIHASHGSVPKW